MEQQRDRSPPRASTTRRALSLVLLVVQLVVFTLGAALAGQSHPAGAGSNGRALVIATAASSRGSVRATSSDTRLELGARARADRGDRGAAPPLDLALPLDVLLVAPAYLVGSLDGRSSTRGHRPPPSVVHGARGPPRG